MAIEKTKTSTNDIFKEIGMSVTNAGEEKLNESLLSNSRFVQGTRMTNATGGGGFSQLENPDAK